MLGAIAGFVAVGVVLWMLGGGLGRVLRGSVPARVSAQPAHHIVAWLAPLAVSAAVVLVAALLVGATIGVTRWHARRRRRYVRLRVEPYRTDTAAAEAVVAMFESLHKRLLARWWRRLLFGQPSTALEVHSATSAGTPRVWLEVTCPAGDQSMVQAALRSAYPNCRLAPSQTEVGDPPAVVRLKKHAEFIKRVKVADHFEHEREPAMNRLMTAIAAAGAPGFVQIALTPTPASFERHAKQVYKHHEARLARRRREGTRVVRDRSLVDESELRGGLDVQHRPLYFTDIRVVAGERRTCERIASELRAAGAENHLVERGTGVRHGVLGLYRRRIERGEGNPWPSWRKGVCASTELAALWHLPSVGYLTVPFARAAVAAAPAPPGILRPRDGEGTLRDALGPVTLHERMRRQNTAVPGTVEQGKTSYLVATVAEDLRRDNCAVIVLDPKGDAAEAAVSLVPPERTCTLLDFSHPTCGFNPLAVQAPADTIADYVVGALKNLFTDADIRASSDRYLRNALIAVLAYDRKATLWDAARLLSVGEEGYAYRARVGARVRELPEFKEISEFFTAELAAQLADARSMTTAKLDAPVNKLARLLNSPSIKRVLLNGSLTVDFDRLISQREVLVVRGALGAMGAGNTSVLMQLLVGMLDAALARQQDLVAAERRVAVALKVDEAPLVLNRGFAETLALKRSAGLETVACWQTEAQWQEREVRDQLDALFAHRVYFATASVADARASASLAMAEFSDVVRPGESLSALGNPDARLRLPKHHAIVSWSTPEGRQPPFLARTIPMRVDRERLALHAARQAARGGRHLADLTQPHWDRREAIQGARPRVEGARAAEAEEEEEKGAAQRETGGAAETGAPRAPHARVARGESAVGAEASAPDAVGGAAEYTETSAPSTPHAPSAAVALPPVAAESYRELVALDGAHRVRRAKPPASPRAVEPERLDIEMLALVADMRHVLSSQVHRRFNPARANTTTQRRLKRLSDAGWVRRLQFHRHDGGGTPMCYTISEAGMELLLAQGRLAGLPEPSSPGQGSQVRADDGRLPRLGRDEEWRLRQARHDVHVAGWVLALERALGGPARGVRLRGAAGSVLSPPLRSTPEGRTALGPSGLRLPGGRTPHEFLSTDGAGGRSEVERFETVRPDATVEVPAALLDCGLFACDGAPIPDGSLSVLDGRAAAPDAPQAMKRETTRPQGRSLVAAPPTGVDVLVEFDDRLPAGRGAAKLERYDHLLAGWSVCLKRYGARPLATPLVVFVCRDRARARECARRADAVLTACRAYAGEYPADWEYPGRTGVVWAAERDIHEGVAHAYGVPRLPPEVRVAAAHGDPHEREVAVRATSILSIGAAWRP
jgi:Replication-relaxation